MRKTPLALVASLVLAASCSHDKPYTISGVIDIPDSLQLGDTIIATPSFEGWQVYMLDMEGAPIDSVEISDNKFAFTGNVDDRSPFFVYLANDICVGMIALEPGDIQITINESTLIASGTSTNDMMTDLDGTLQDLQEDVYNKMSLIASESEDGVIPDEVMAELYVDFKDQTTHLLDSFYNAYEGKLGALYVVNYKTAEVQTSDELNVMLAEYPEEIRNSQLMRSRLDYMKQMEAYYKMFEEEQEVDPEFLQLMPSE